MNGIKRQASTSVFSYEIKTVLPTITLFQNATGFSLIIELEKLEKTLRVTHFTLDNVNTRLREESQNLCDAAEIDIALQGLSYLFSYAVKHEMEEVLLILPQSEAIQLSALEGLFQEVSPLTLGKERRMALTLSSLYHDYFLERVSGIKAKIRQELWFRQREDEVLKNYLQNYYRYNFSFIQEDRLTDTQFSGNGNVITFPKHI